MDWHTADIKAAISKKNTSLAELARKNKLAPTTLRTALCRTYKRGQEIIAECIGVPPQTIWPSRYQSKTQDRASKGTSV